jgi:enoyl-CoA hydratase/carnithine racemase
MVDLITDRPWFRRSVTIPVGLIEAAYNRIERGVLGLEVIAQRSKVGGGHEQRNTKTSAVNTPLIHVTDRDGITVLQLDRPPANALDPSLLNAGVEVIENLMATPPAAIVITGTGKFFSSGADLRVVPELSAAEQADLSRSISFLFATMYQFPRPVVSAVNGHAVAGGLIVAMCADHRVVGRSGKFGLTEVKVGIPFPSAAMAVVQRELTPPIVRRLVFGTDLFDAGTAVEYGIFDEIVDDDVVLERSIDKARELAALPKATYELVKRRLRGGAFDQRGMFGGAAAAADAVAEARTAAGKVLDAPSE